MDRKGKQRRQARWVLPTAIAGALVAVIAFTITQGDEDSTPVPTVDVSQDQHSADGLPYPTVARISPDEAHAMAQRGEALIVDVRERAAYEESHVSGALALPESELDTRIGELPRDQLIVTYCT
ncbi:MAG: rhodanese-like domain-containing protein [Acidimicrobiia bacterium]|nr:rhodanese-like domain-containing protein [Acidimicrobiia bacterium]NNL28873.1 rhodanese-like domain-containing protein [Acidimicrobiia bacterium]NNL98341.1 rhodanese-like domain-containing protein [Acidimicrobiia bacterium]